MCFFYCTFARYFVLIIPSRVREHASAVHAYLKQKRNDCSWRKIIATEKKRWLRSIDRSENRKNKINNK